jgi:hypothetical protein
MPKEITHWLIAEQAVERLAEDSLLGSSARKAMNVVRLGAIFHDVLYYLTDIPARHPARQVPDTLHGVMGSDTYKIIRALAQAYYHHRDTPQLLAFLVGVMSHIQADVVFHPMVYHVSGNPFDRATKSRATRHHRAFESVIDMIVCHSTHTDKRFHLRQFLRSAETDMQILYRILYQGFTTVPEATLAHHTMRAYNRLGVFRKLETSPIMNAIHRAMKSILPTSLREILCLGYDETLLIHAQEQGIEQSAEILYRHPVDNTPQSHSIDNLMEESIQRTVALCRQIDQELHDFAPVLEYERGASLETGMVGVKIRQMMYFRDTPLLRVY